MSVTRWLEHVKLATMDPQQERDTLVRAYHAGIVPDIHAVFAAHTHRQTLSTPYMLLTYMHTETTTCIQMFVQYASLQKRFDYDINLLFSLKEIIFSAFSSMDTDPLQ